MLGYVGLPYIAIVWEMGSCCSYFWFPCYTGSLISRVVLNSKEILEISYKYIIEYEGIAIMAITLPPSIQSLIQLDFI